MPTITSQRPGIYSNYTIAPSFRGNLSVKFAGIVAKASKGTKHNVYTIDNYTQARSVFGEDTSNTCMLSTIKILLDSGISKLFCVTPSISGNTPTQEDYNIAFEKLESIESIGGVVCDSSNIPVLLDFKKSIQTSCDKLKERLGFCGISDVSDAISAAQKINSERMILTTGLSNAYDKKIHSICNAAAFMGVVLGISSPNYNLNGSQLPEYIVAQADPITETEIQNCLANGVCVFEQVPYNLECIKSLTTRTITDGKFDRTFSSINTILTIDNVMMRIRELLKLNLKGARSSTQTQQSIASQIIVKLEQLLDEGLIVSYDIPKVSSDKNDPCICIVEVAFELNHVINQILISAQIKL